MDYVLHKISGILSIAKPINTATDSKFPQQKSDVPSNGSIYTTAFRL